MAFLEKGKGFAKSCHETGIRRSKMSYTLNDWEGETKTKSTETLGIDKNRNKDNDDEQSDNGGGKTRKYLMVSVVIIFLLLIVCVVLSVFLAVQVSKQQQKSSKEVPTPPPGKPNGNATKQQVHCYTPECLQFGAEYLRNMNTSADPCEDFFQYSCGSWIKDHPIPPSRNAFDTFFQVYDKNSRSIRRLLEEEDQLPDTSAVRKAKLYFKSCLNDEGVEEATKQSLSAFLAKHGSWALDNQTWNSTEWSWFKVLIAIHREVETTPLFVHYIDINPRNSSQYTLGVSRRVVKSLTHKLKASISLILVKLLQIAVKNMV